MSSDITDLMHDSGPQKTLIGKGPVSKGSWYEVHKVNGKFYAVVTDGTWTHACDEIQEFEISQYVDREDE